MPAYGKGKVHAKLKTRRHDPLQRLLARPPSPRLSAADRIAADKLARSSRARDAAAAAEGVVVKDEADVEEDDALPVGTGDARALAAVAVKDEYVEPDDAIKRMREAAAATAAASVTTAVKKESTIDSDYEEEGGEDEDTDLDLGWETYNTPDVIVADVGLPFPFIVLITTIPDVCYIKNHSGGHVDFWFYQDDAVTAAHGRAVRSPRHAFYYEVRPYVVETGVYLVLYDNCENMSGMIRETVTPSDFAVIKALLKCGHQVSGYAILFDAETFEFGSGARPLLGRAGDVRASLEWKPYCGRQPW
ncbi:hypothetical protein BJ508DRAFT_311098 [Ascobolus immersus RN42]|uniref:Uncharacterized protein n=1 Tax=Ascobolus immersus RN42 TaxID=1160509 RepID=A0A3N4HTW4_ASCIM|nr:hypothetical protein BJ508DRAFT_311098 [Ascobolus immersus RN42]